ncbi:hypothetical protein L596_012507 [Steinernema carpocapsae]|uniref:7TM GPCR serpentine receptor class x (Srx) domain-containing protein n=1 Tax=Steinernema carpocapsae TaxID=34508 RepID=A0A4U5NX91_STECR|nr:hypothetical protein L596_012507 [Steinernema carpocapsae]
MLTVGTIGVLINIFVIYGVSKVKSFGESFGKIVISQSLANCGNAAVFGLLVGPITFSCPKFHSTYWGARCGQLLILFWNADLFSHLVTTMNRFCSTFFPFKYPKIFDVRMTKFYLSIVWIIAVCQVLAYFSVSPDLLRPLRRSLLDLYLSLTVIGFITVVDLITLVKLKIVSKKVNDQQEDRKRRRREIRFFFQTLSQATIMITELTFYFYISNMIINKWLKFACTSVAWMLLQMSDGLVVLILNKELRSRHPRSVSSVAMTKAASRSYAVSTRTEQTSNNQESSAAPN